MKPYSEEKLKKIYGMVLANIYPFYVEKAKRRGTTKADVDEALMWLTGYTKKGLEAQLKKKSDMKTFFAKAPKKNPKRKLIKGLICGIRVEDIKEPLMREIRYMDKLVEEVTKGRPIEKIIAKK